MAPETGTEGFPKLGLPEIAGHAAEADDVAAGEFGADLVGPPGDGEIAGDSGQDGADYSTEPVADQPGDGRGDAFVLEEFHGVEDGAVVESTGALAFTAAVGAVEDPGGVARTGAAAAKKCYCRAVGGLIGAQKQLAPYGRLVILHRPTFDRGLCHKAACRSAILLTPFVYAPRACEHCPSPCVGSARLFSNQLR